MNSTNFVLALFVVVILLLCSGLYLAFYKRKTDSKPQPPEWMFNLPELPRSMQLKEFYKQVYPAFTQKWFLEYWQGQRSAFKAWATWFFFGGLILGLMGGASIILFSGTGNFFAILKVIRIIFFLYITMAAIILWRCAYNSTSFYKYFARIFAIYMVLSALIDVINDLQRFFSSSKEIHFRQNVINNSN